MVLFLFPAHQWKSVGGKTISFFQVSVLHWELAKVLGFMLISPVQRGRGGIYQWNQVCSEEPIHVEAAFKF